MKPLRDPSGAAPGRLVPVLGLAACAAILGAAFVVAVRLDRSPTDLPRPSGVAAPPPTPPAPPPAPRSAEAPIRLISSRSDVAALMSPTGTLPFVARLLRAGFQKLSAYRVYPSQPPSQDASQQYRYDDHGRLVGVRFPSGTEVVTRFAVERPVRGQPMGNILAVDWVPPPASGAAVHLGAHRIDNDVGQGAAPFSSNAPFCVVESYEKEGPLAGGERVAWHVYYRVPGGDYDWRDPPSRRIGAVEVRHGPGALQACFALHETDPDGPVLGSVACDGDLDAPVRRTGAAPAGFPRSVWDVPEFFLEFFVARAARG